MQYSVLYPLHAWGIIVIVILGHHILLSLSCQHWRSECGLDLQSKLAVAHEHLNYDEHLGTLSVQSKLKDSITHESSCRTWNRLLLGYKPRSVFFYSSCSLWHSVYISQFRTLAGAKWTLCGYSIALSQGCFIYHHDKVLYYLTTELSSTLMDQL